MIKSPRKGLDFSCHCSISSEKYKIKDLNSFTYDRHSFSLLFLLYFFLPFLTHSLRVLAQCVHNAKRESRVFFVHWPLLYCKWKNQFRAAFSLHVYILLLLPFPPYARVVSLSLRVENVCTHNARIYSLVRWMGKLNWKHILLGIWSITQLIMTFSLAACVFIRDFLFSRSFRYFFLTLSRSSNWAVI